jgi:hypothetical protein
MNVVRSDTVEQWEVQYTGNEFISNAMTITEKKSCDYCLKSVRRQCWNGVVSCMPLLRNKMPLLCYVAFTDSITDFFSITDAITDGIIEPLLFLLYHYWWNTFIPECALLTKRNQ